ncbi:MAG: indole-3-glycerol phosphate synthase TrpC [Lachnospiraceae bacterium]|nr:indole-3-glycerol phosphate synthase TrpC [Lachnospiraceae bacterium]
MILDEIAAKTKVRVAEAKKQCSLEEMRTKALAMDSNTGFPFEQALRKEHLSFICEVKKASPSKGVIAENFPYMDIARAYEAAGADAVSVLTEPYYFQGENRFLQEIVQEISLPVIRKDFTVDPYMIYEAKVLGASAVLLICAILTEEQIKEYLELAHSLGLSAIVEAHDETEVAMALGRGARIIGVNNRNLKDFTVDIENSIRLRKGVPEEIVFVSESGMKTAADIARLRENGTDAVLIGETLMRSPDKKAMLDQLRG